MLNKISSEFSIVINSIEVKFKASLHGKIVKTSFSLTVKKFIEFFSKTQY